MGIKLVISYFIKYILREYEQKQKYFSYSFYYYSMFFENAFRKRSTGKVVTTYINNAKMYILPSLWNFYIIIKCTLISQ